MLERKHKTPKRYAQTRQNTSDYESGLIEDATADQLYHLGDAFKPRELLPCIKPAAKSITTIVESALPWSRGANVYQSSKARTSTGRQVLWHDVIIWSACDVSCLIGQIHFHVQVEDVAWTCVSPWSIQEWSTDVVKCVVKYNPTFIDTRRIIDACVHSKAKIGEVSQVLVPSSFHR